MDQDQHIVISTFYKFVSLPDCEEWQEKIAVFCEQNGIFGTLLLANEGINATIAGTRPSTDAFLAFLRSEPRFADLVTKESFAAEIPFRRMKVRLKKEIVALGKPEVDPNQAVGTYVPPKEWNEIISDPDVILIDARNEYEYGVGTFEGAVNPHTYAFRQFPTYVEQNLDPAKHKKVAMFCTGGIRCEKASSYLLEMGFEEVFHLKGGILKYLEDVPEDNSMWRGECFVFDDRVTVTHGLEPGDQHVCHACGRELSDAELQHPDYHIGVSCPSCIENIPEVTRQSYEEWQAILKESLPKPKKQKK